MVQDTGTGASVVMTTNGDTLYYNSGRQRLPKGDNDEVLMLKSGLPSWEPSAVSPIMTTNGDTLYYNSGRQRLAKGSDGDVLTLASGIPSWASAGGGGVWSLEGTVTGSGAATLSVSSLADKDIYQVQYAIAGTGTSGYGTAIRFNSVEGSAYRGTIGSANYEGAYTGGADNSTSQGLLGNSGHTKSMYGWVNVYKQNSAQGRTSGVIYRGLESVSASTHGFDATTFNGGGNVGITGAIDEIEILLTDSIVITGEMSVFSMDFSS